ncbi:hypothetical protein MTR67_007109, partial [Solanum verrucosum]
FKDECNTEKKIASALKSFLETSMFVESEEKLRRKLFDLLQNVALIKDPEDPRKFYPRFNVEDTTSFVDLDQHSQNVLKRLYYDYYFHRQEGLWRDNAFKTLPVLLNSSDMLACGEDLGLIPSCVHPVMQELGLVGLRIQRMPSEPDVEFGIPSQYNYMTVCAPSCHDCSTLRAWWEEDEERRHRFFQAVMGSDELPPDQCTPEIVHFVLRQHVESPSMWSIFPLQDLLALKEDYTTRPAVEETINDPTNPKHYWRYRMCLCPLCCLSIPHSQPTSKRKAGWWWWLMVDNGNGGGCDDRWLVMVGCVHVTMESLLSDKDLTKTIKDLVRGSGRFYPQKDLESGQAKLKLGSEHPSQTQKYGLANK